MVPAGRFPLLRRRQVLQAGAACLVGEAAFGAPAPFQLAYFETYKPLSFVEGEIKGLLVDILDEVIDKQLHVPCSHEGLPWPRAQSLVERGQRDAICTIATPERLAYAVAVDTPVVVASLCVFALKDNAAILRLRAARTLDELKSLSPAVISYSANGWAKSALGEFNVVWGNDFTSAVRMLLAGRGDIMIENALTMDYTLRQMALGDRVEALPNAMAQAKFRLLVSKKSEHLALLAPFEKALQRFKLTPQYAELFARYGVRQYADPSAGPVVAHGAAARWAAP